MMNCFILYLVSAVVLLGTGSCFSIKQNSTDMKQSIIGGEISSAAVPYHVSMKCDDNYFCGGALISPQHVLTAGHCIAYMIKQNCVVKVLAGSTYVNGGVSIEVERREIHPGYSSSTYEHDIGVLKVASPFPLSGRIQPIALTPYPPVNNEVITVTGYGRVNPTNNNYLSSALKQYSSWLLTYEECYKHLGSSVFPSDVCDYGQKNIGTCQGDSGSPVVNSHYLIGVVSGGFYANNPEEPVLPCATGLPNTFASVYYHLDFINAELSR